jgi:hypothetical protein
VPPITEIQSRLAYVSSVKTLEEAKNTPGCLYMRIPVEHVGYNSRRYRPNLTLSTVWNLAMEHECRDPGSGIRRGAANLSPMGPRA